MMKEKTFEDTFNEWYKKFLDEERKLNEELSAQKKARDDLLNQARKEALETIHEYEKEQKERLEAEKAKMNFSKNNFGDLDVKHLSEVKEVQQAYNRNYNEVVNFLVESVLNVELTLPEIISNKHVSE